MPASRTDSDAHLLPVLLSLLLGFLDNVPTYYHVHSAPHGAQVIQALEGDRKRYDRVVDSAQRFAYTYLSTHNKAMYVRQALRSYNALFEDMGELMAQLEVGSSEHRGGTLPLMELLLHIKKFAMSKNPSLSLEIDGVRW